LNFVFENDDCSVAELALKLTQDDPLLRAALALITLISTLVYKIAYPVPAVPRCIASASNMTSLDAGARLSINRQR